MAYATDKEATKALGLGYSVSNSAQMGTSFARGGRHIWSTRLGWQTADLIDGMYRNHKFFENLNEALERPL